MAGQSDPPVLTIRSGREALGWTQRQLAEELDVNIGTISRWERGALEPPKIALACLAAMVLARELLAEVEASRKKRKRSA